MPQDVISNFDRSLSIEMFNRSWMSATVGVLGVGIIVYPHFSTYSIARYALWAAMMFSIFGARILLSRFALRRNTAGMPIYHLVNVEAILCAFSGIGWGYSLTVFNSSSTDSLFYLRLMTLAAAMSFVISSMTVYLRVFLSFVLPLFFVVVIYLFSSSFIQAPQDLIVCGVFYVTTIVGVAVLNNRRIRADVANQLAVQTLTDELNVALKTERVLRTDISKTAVTDELTGILNRRGILESFALEIARSKRFGRSLAVLMIDIDFFKSINDKYGHAHGDLALRFVVHALQSKLREADLIGRFGGEEFLAILPNMDEAGALAGAARLRECVESNSLDMDGHPISITISIGVAVLRDSDDIDSLIARSDSALYTAKHNGRNQVYLNSEQ